ncbi:acyl-CoA dehydrogenase [Kibdelosporangium phytohabitans]|uniref:acyl-CoA oxidase n=1 Tax=Kibdelosporangium phytohabitans TaxID=860235 RepID=A0A0N9I895_9PSEU|nr:acyl-CoA dehydrogenase [Kibdelosporangium phytohabitans]ALG10861.1 acyl-CoA oxidase [Kibdelosporangium phytohabitans]MBE1462041.1 acyl-CoA oxidase [Kibdelosporangium phytohabitans]
MIEAARVTDVLDGRWPQLRRELRERLAENKAADTARLDMDAYRALVTDQLRELAGARHARLGFGRAHGGEGDIGGSVVSFQVLGYGDLSLMVKAGVQWGLFGGAIQMLGTERHHARYLPDVMSLELPGCFAMTESGHGSDVQHLRTTARYDNGEFVVNTPDDDARKDYIGNAARDGRTAVVFAQLILDDRSYGVHAFVVPIRHADGRPMPGVRIGDCGPKAGLNGVDNGRLWFDNVRVPKENLLNRYGDVTDDGQYTSSIESDSRRFFTMLGTLVRGRISVAGAAGSATQRALTIAVHRAQSRRQFRRPDSDTEIQLLDYLAHQRKLLPALAKSYALHFAQDELVQMLHEVQGTPEPDPIAQRQLESRAAGIKAVATWHATRTIQTAREACGGAGYLVANVLPVLKADTDVFTTFEGDNTVLLQLVAKGLLTDYRDNFADLSPLATARLVAEQLMGSVLERIAARQVIARFDDDDLRSRAWQRSLFEDREQHVLSGLAGRLRAAASSGTDPFDVFNDVQDHVLLAGRTHIERLVFDAFDAAVGQCADEEVKALLGQVLDLYALATIEEDRAWFLEHGRITPARAKKVIAEVNALCKQLRPHAVTLVDAFAIPRQYLA